MSSDRVDVCVPTRNPNNTVLREALIRLFESITAAGLTPNQLIVIDSTTNGQDQIPFVGVCEEFDVRLEYRKRYVPLATAREELISTVETDWFVFLDDDAIVSEAYISWLWDWTCSDRVGAVRGRKERHVERHPTDWLKQRVRRAGVHCLLVRTDAVRDLAYPSDITGIYEDEYLRYHIENEYRWIYEPLATFTHENQNRHPPGWEEGKLAGKYDFEPFYMEALNVPYSLVQWRNPWPYTKRLFGWLYGRYAL